MDINISAFVPVLLPVALSPGASFTLAINGALADGRRGLITTLIGTALGIYTHALLIGLGVTSIVATSPVLLSVLKIAGMTYLLWLGIQLLRSAFNANEMAFDQQGAAITLKDAWLANVLNPKAILFYLTVVSQFVGDKGEIGHYFILASVHIAVMVIWIMAISKVIIFSSRRINTLRLKKYVNALGGILLIFFALTSLLH